MKIEKLYPSFKDYLWGGEKLKTDYNKDTDKDVVAESWELSFHEDGLTRLENGKTLAETAEKEDLGTNCEKYPFFPVMIKFIDAKGDLSIQVHPSDEYALKHENSFGKTEMWYIVQADKGAGIYLGFKQDVTKEQVLKAIDNNSLTDLLNFYEVKSGECYYIPSGTVHAICKGCLICEIQQNSNLTYRLYDYGRRDKNGKLRELHIDKSLDVMNLRKFSPLVKKGDFEIANKYFTVHKKTVDGEMKLHTDASSFKCVTITKGDGTIDGRPFIQGDSFFVPANYGGFVLRGAFDAIITET